MKKVLTRILLLLIITCIVECVFFNYPFWRTSISGEQSTNVEYSVDSNDNKSVISLKNIDNRITSVKIHFEDLSKSVKDYYYNGVISYTIRFATTDYSYWTQLNSKSFEYGEDACFKLDTHDNCTNMQILTDISVLPEIEKITINEPIFDFSILRFTIIFVICLFVDLLKNTSLLSAKYDFSRKMLDMAIVGLFVVILIVYIFEQNNMMSLTQEELNNVSTVYKEPMLSAMAIQNNGVLDLEVSDSLKEMSNPYDAGKRDSSDISYEYDVSYYNGNYYSYFGIAPIISLVIPSRIILGRYFSSSVYNTIFLVLGIITAFAVYKKLIKRFVIENDKSIIPAVLFYLGFFAIIFGSNYLTILSGRKYDLAITTGIFYILASAWLILSLYESTKYRLVKYSLLGFTLSMIVLSKPSYILYYPLLFVLAWGHIKDIITHLKENRQELIKCILGTGVPLVIFAIFQMRYNYVRFENVLEFGAKYQLTSYNMNTLMSFSFGKILFGLSKYLFTMPVFDLVRFPFFAIQSGIYMGGLNELVYQNHIVGICFIPMIWIILFSKTILSKGSNNKQYKALLYSALIIGVLLIILTTCMGGISENYIIDYKLILCLFVSVMWFRLMVQDYKEKSIQKIIVRLFIAICLITIIMYLPISFTSEANYLQNQNLHLTNALTHIFEFWK